MSYDIQGFRLSPQQKHLWLLQQKSQAFRAQCTIRIDGSLNIESIKTALQSVVNQHDILRTTFHREQGMLFPLQVIAEQDTFTWHQIDLQGTDAATQAARVGEVSRAELQQPLPLNQGPLLRAALLQLADHSQILLLTLPALCADAATLSLLTEDLAAAYAAQAPAVDIEDLVQYIQFSDWQYSLLEEDESADGLTYWRNQAQRAQVDWSLPLAQQPADDVSFTPAIWTTTLPNELAARLDALADDQQTTTRTLLLACWQVLCWRLSGRSTLSIGYISDGRSYEELKRTAGPLAKTLPLSWQADSHSSFLTVARTADDTIAEAESWQDYFVWGQEADSPDTITTPPVGFFYAAPTPQHAGSVSFTIQQWQLHLDQFAAQLVCTRHGEGITLDFYYDMRLFDSDRMRDLAEEFATLVRSALDRPSAPIRDLDLLGDREQQELLVAFNSTAAAYPHDRCVHELIAEQATRTPDASAVIFGAGTGEQVQMSYAELDARSNQLARYLQTLGVGRQTQAELAIGIWLERSPELIVAILAVLKAGGCYVPLDPAQPQARLHAMLDDAQVAVLLTTSQLRAAALEVGQQIPHIVLLDTAASQLAAESDAPSTSSVTGANTAYIMYTSGSTGRPKGVMVTHQGLINYLSWATRFYGLHTGKGAPIESSISFDLTVTSLFTPLLAGRSVYLLPEDQGGTVLSTALHTIGDFSVVKLTPAHLDVLSQLLPPASVADSTQTLVIGGEALLARDVDFWRQHAPAIRLINEYGPTESVVGCCIYEILPQAALPDAVPIGRPIANTQLYVLDQALRPVPRGVAGELYIGGAGVARGYYRHPDLTAEHFIPDPFSAQPGQRLYKTGDLVRHLPSGDLEYLGRVDFQVKVRGYRIELGEIEAVLSQHPAVRRAAVVLTTDNTNTPRLVAYVIEESQESGARNQTDDEDGSRFSVPGSTLGTFLASRLPDYMVPTLFVPLEKLPLTANGKVDRKALPRPDWSGAGVRAAFVAPRNPTEEKLAAIWQRVLGLERVSIHDQFFRLGGDSIRGIQVMAQARQHGLIFTIEQLFAHPTIEQLAQQLEIVEQPPVARAPAEPLLAADDRRRLPPTVEDAYPLAALQAGILFHAKWERNSATYHDVFSFHIEVPFDAEALRQAASYITSRHPILRTTFDLTGYSQPLQLVQRQATLPLVIEDWRDQPHDLQERRLAAFQTEERCNPFDERSAPLARMFIHRRTEHTLQFTFSFDHAILDGWSTASLLTEFFGVYLALTQGEALPDAPPLSSSYRDFIALEQAIQENSQAANFWRDRLADATPLELPRLLAPRQQPEAAELATVAVDLPPALAERLRAVADRLGVPIKSVLLAAHLRVMRLLSGQRDVLTGVVENGRVEDQDGERVLGLFLNTLPLRLDVADMTWAKLIRSAFQTQQELSPFRRYPLSSIQRQHGNQPLFDTIFDYTHFHIYRFLESQVKVLAIDIFEQTNFALYVRFWSDVWSSDLAFSLSYDRSRLADEQVAAIRHYYVAALETIADHVDEPIERACLLTPHEQRSLQEWSATSAEHREQPVHRIIEEQVAASPDAIAVVVDAATHERAQLTYQQLNRRANQLAHHLRSLGVGPETRVAVCVERSLEMVVGLLAVLKAGGAYVPLDPAYPAERIQYMLDDARAAVVLTQRSLRERLPVPAGAVVLAIDEREPAWNAAPIGNLANIVAVDNACYVIYTSGSTGRPKGVQIPHLALRNLLQSMQQQIGLSHNDRLLAVTTLAFDIATLELFLPLISAATLVIARRDEAADAALLSTLLDREAITAMQATPATWRALQTIGWQGKRDLQILCGGEELPRDLAEWLLTRGASVWNLYGPTETTIWSLAQQLQPGAALISLGRPLANTELYLLDAGLQRTPIGTPGEVYLGGDGLARGYVDRPGLTAERFIPHPFARPEDARPGSRLYRTGDLARYLPDGSIEFLGRSDQQIKLRGFRIEPGEIEAVLRQHPAVRDAVVAIRAFASGTPGLVAYLVAKESLEPGAQNQQDESEAGSRLLVLDSADLRQYVSERLPSYMIPAAFVQLDALPLTANGKLDRKALPAPQTGEPAKLYVAPSTPLETLVAGIWREVLGVEQVSLNDTFFELGGHSLLAIQISARIRVTCGVEVPLASIFAEPTVAHMARTIEAALRDEQPQLPPLHPSASEQRALSFAQQRLWFLNQLEPESPVYNIPAAVRLSGPLDSAALRESLAEVMRRHQVLTARFPAVAGNPVVEQSEQQLPLTVIDLREYAEAERSQEIERVSREAVRAPFNLATGPLLRVVLLQLADTEHLALVTMHHIISDGWSLDIFIHELTTLYQSFAAERPAALPELPIQYHDYAAWQRDWLAPGAPGQTLERLLAFWKDYLQSGERPLAPLDLPSDYPRPQVQTYHGARLPLTIPAALSDRIKALSQQTNATSFMTLLAGFATLLSRYTGQDDLVVGTPVANRPHRELESLIGFFVNMLVLRTDLSGQPSFRELLDRVRTSAVAAYTHQELPFEQLVEAIRPDRDLSRSPLFQVMFALQNPMQHPLAVPGLTLESLPIDSGTAKYDLSLELSEQGDSFGGWIEYNTDLFHPDTIARLADQYLTLLDSATADPDQSVADLPILPAAQYAQLVTEWNATGRAFPQDASIHQLFEAQVARTPDAIAAIFEDRPLSYAELNARADRVARYLQPLGVGRGTRVGISVERSLEMLIGLLGILKAGAAYVPLDPNYPQERIAFVLHDSQAAVLLTLRRLVDRLPQHTARIVCLDALDEAGIPPHAPRAIVTGDDLAYVIYTSGSTGQPKGVMVSHRNVVNFCAGMDDAIGGEQPGTWLSVTSISFDISVLELFWTLSRGYRVVIQGEQVLNPAAANPARHKPIDFSLFYFASEEQGGDKYRLLIEGAKFADQHGFTAVWTPERHFHEFGGLYPNPAITSAALATITQRVQLRAGSVVMPLHDPIRVAEEWSVVDNISQGRVGIAFASGWHADDFVFFPERYRDRKQATVDGLRAVQQLWRGEALTVQSGAGNPIDVRIFPKPVQPELPIWITASESPETFRQAGELGANLLTHLLGQTVEQLAEKIALYRQAWREHGHNGAGGHVTLMLHTFVGEDREQVRAIVREPFRAYLRSNIGLLKNLARSQDQERSFESFTTDDLESLLDHAFERYFETSGLFGIPDTCGDLIDRLKLIGVDEIGCLIDFGVDPNAVLTSLEHLNTLRARSNTLPNDKDRDYSLPAQIERYGVSHMQCTPSMAQLLAADNTALSALGSLQTLLLGGEALPVALAEQLRTSIAAQIFNMYGPTETTIWSAVQRVAETERGIPIGRPIANTQIYLLDQWLHPAPLGVPGELYIGGAGVAWGYLDRPALTAERFIPDPFAEPGSRLYRTGDLARYLPDGSLQFIGRVDQQIKIRGHRIEPGEIDAVLAQHPGVREAVVMAREDRPGDTRLVAYVVPAQRTNLVPRSRSADFDPDQILAEYQRTQLPNGLTIAHLSDFQTTGIYREIFEDERYLRHGIALNDGDCVVDIGANIGLFTLWAHHTRRKLTSFAIEPIPPTFRTLQANVALYDLNARLYNCGIADRVGQDTFTFYPYAPGLSGRAPEAEEREATRSIILNWLQTTAGQSSDLLPEQDLDALLDRYHSGETFTCPIITLSSLIAENQIDQIDLLKIDAERSEVDILRGIQERDWAKIKQIVIEIHTRKLLSEVAALLEHHGYNFAVDEFIAVDSGGEHVFMLYAQHPSYAGRGNGDPAGRTIDRLTPDALLRFARERLPDYMTPHSYLLLPALPLTPNGKIDRAALPAPGAHPGGESKQAFVPQTRIERTLAEIWSEALPSTVWDPDDNFFELGGHSLMATRVIARIRDSFNVDVTLRSLFMAPTFRSMLELIESMALEQVDSDTLDRLLDEMDALDEDEAYQFLTSEEFDE